MPSKSFSRIVRMFSTTMSVRKVSMSPSIRSLSPTNIVAVISAGLKPPMSTITSCGETTPKLAKASVCFTMVLKDSKSFGIFRRTTKSTLCASIFKTTALPVNSVVVVVVVSTASPVDICKLTTAISSSLTMSARSSASSSCCTRLSPRVRKFVFKAPSTSSWTSFLYGTTSAVTSATEGAV